MMETHLRYLPPFSMWKQCTRVVSQDSHVFVSVDYEDFLRLIKLMLRGVEFDEEFYKQKYEDVAEAVRAGTYSSGREHFIENGYFEGRQPFALAVDEPWYRENNKDVEESLNAGVIASVSEHFSDHGYEEGRLPAPL